MQHSLENLLWATEILQQVGHLPGFPQTEGQLLAVAKEFLNFVGDQPPHKYSQDGGPDVGEVWIESEPVSAGDTAEWLIAQVVARFEKFPTGTKMRELYETKYSPADGVRSSDLT